MSRTHKKPVVTLAQNIQDVKEQLKGRVPDSVEHSAFDGNTTTHMRRNLSIRTTPVAIGIPCDELMFSQFFTNLMTISIMPWDAFITTQNTLVQDARNTIHNLYLERSKAPYLFMLDSDVLPPPDVIERLIAHNLPAVAGYYHKKEKFRVKDLQGNEFVTQRPVVYDFAKIDPETGRYLYNERSIPKTGLEVVGAVGAGCWMIKREVLEKIGKSPFSFAEGGEDMDFCRKIQKAGYDVVVDWDCPCAHVGTFWV